MTIECRKENTAFPGRVFKKTVLPPGKEVILHTERMITPPWSVTTKKIRVETPDIICRETITDNNNPSVEYFFNDAINEANLGSNPSPMGDVGKIRWVETEK